MTEDLEALEQEPDREEADIQDSLNNLQRGSECIAGYVKNLPATSGVYRMIGQDGKVLYVGKAKSLKSRVVSYTRIQQLSRRLQRMVSQTYSMEFVHTHTEVEALLLESNLIKKLKPHYNILLRDDKSFPYILLTQNHNFPQVKKHRGAQKEEGEYFGPFANAGAVNRTIAVLQKAFRLRTCTDSYFKVRKRPCLQYHIKRCTAPCVGHVSKDQYSQQIAQAHRFLKGKSREIQESFAQDMQQASADQDYELAAEYRDRIRALNAVQIHQDINIAGIEDSDVIAIEKENDKSCVQVFFFRGGQNFGNRSYFPRHASDETKENILAVFLAQFYESKPVPRTIMVSHTPLDKKLLESALQQKIESNAIRKKYAVSIQKPSRGVRQKLMHFALRNAKDALAMHMSHQASQTKILAGVAELFEMENSPKRIEIYDNSHISGTNMVGAMVVAGSEGFQKNGYRKFNIRQAAESDDYGMMREVMTRRFGKALEEGIRPEDESWPDLLLIDGGQGQYNAVKEILCELGIDQDMTLVSIAKGPERNAGREKFFMEGRMNFQLPEQDPVLFYLQKLRDEAHRFAIGAHRSRRKKSITQSRLDDIPGIGSERKKSLLRHFGSSKEVERAGLSDLQSVEGISKAMAQKIYDYFQGDSH